MPRRAPTVTVTNRGASRLPRALGAARSTPSAPPPVEPKTIAKSKQITSGPRVLITNPSVDRVARQK